MNARNESDIFAAFRSDHPEDGYRWREYWREYYMTQLDFYHKNRWALIPIGKFSKRPLAGFAWSSRKLTQKEAIWYAGGGFNLAVVAGKDLAIIDWDGQRQLDGKLPGTLTMLTARGLQLWCKGPYDPKFSEPLRARGFDTPRHGTMFSLVPLSKTCSRDKGGSCFCVEHDFRIREWEDIETPLLPFSEVARALT